MYLKGSFTEFLIHVVQDQASSMAPLEVFSKSQFLVIPSLAVLGAQALGAAWLDSYANFTAFQLFYSNKSLTSVCLVSAQ